MDGFFNKIVQPGDSGDNDVMKMNAIKQMEHFARTQPGAISLSQGIPFLNSDEALRKAAIEALEQGKVDAYSDPQGIKELRHEIASDLQANGMDYSSEEIIVTAGAIEALSATLLTILNETKNEVIIPTPTYSAYFKVVQVAKGRAVPIKLHEDRGWRLDINELEKNISDKTAVILICNPNNPTGNIYSKDQLDQLCELAKKYNLVLILDEVYKNMVFEQGHWYVPCENSNNKNYIVRIVSFSKDFALSGWRVGYLHTSQVMVDRILPVHDALINCTPVISQYAAIEAIRQSKRIFENNIQTYTKNRDIMVSYLDKLNGYLDYSMPQGSYFFFPKFKQPTDESKFCEQLFEEQKVTVVPGDDFGPGGENHLRICFGRSEEAVKEGMERLAKFVLNV